MLTLSNNLKDSLLNNSNLVWITQVTLDDRTHYWSSKPITFSDVGAVVGVYPIQGGIDTIEQGVDIIGGGSISAVGNTSITLNELANAEAGTHSEFKPYTYGTEWIHRQVKIGIVSDETTQAITDVLWLYIGIIDDYSFSRSTVGLSVISERETDQLLIPQIIIEKTTYPNAPDESLDMPIPILYGDFEVDSAGTDLYNKFGSTVPMICYDQYANSYFVADHITNHASGEIFYHDGGMKNYAITKSEDLAGGETAPTCSVDDSGKSTVKFAAGRILAFYRVTFSYRSYNNNVTDYDSAIDGDATSYASVPNTAGKTLELCIDGIPNSRVPETAGLQLPKVFIVTNNDVVSNQSFVVGYIEEDNIPFDIGAIQPATAIQEIAILDSSLYTSLNMLTSAVWYVRTNPSPDPAPDPETLEVYSMGLEFNFVVYERLGTPGRVQRIPQNRIYGGRSPR